MVAVVGASVVAGALGAATATLAAWPLGAGAALVAAAVLLTGAGLAAAVRAQASGWPRTAGVATAVPAAAAWVLLVLVALGAVTGADPRAVPGWALVVPVVLVPVAGLAVALALRALPLLSRGAVARAGGLVPAVSGALASLDLSLAWDVVSEHRWRDRGAVRLLPRPVGRRGRARAGRPGPAAPLPGRLVRLARAAAVPLAAQAAGVGPVKVVRRRAHRLRGRRCRCCPRCGSSSAAPAWRGCCPSAPRWPGRPPCVVPLGAAAAFGLAVVPALPPVAGRPLLGLAAGVARHGVRGAVDDRAPTGLQPPLVSTPAGGVPTNLYGSILRGFDVLLLTTAPVLIGYSSTGAVWSLVLSGVVMSFLLLRE